MKKISHGNMLSIKTGNEVFSATKHLEILFEYF